MIIISLVFLNYSCNLRSKLDDIFAAGIKEQLKGEILPKLACLPFKI